MFLFKEKPAFIYDDDKCTVYEEIENQQASIHYKIISKTPVSILSKANVDDEKILGHMLLVAKELAVAKGLSSSGYHVMVDEDYRSGRLIAMHVFERALHHMLWPMGPGSRL